MYIQLFVSINLNNFCYNFKALFWGICLFLSALISSDKIVIIQFWCRESSYAFSPAVPYLPHKITTSRRIEFQKILPLERAGICNWWLFAVVEDMPTTLFSQITSDSAAGVSMTFDWLYTYFPKGVWIMSYFQIASAMFNL